MRRFAVLFILAVVWCAPLAWSQGPAHRLETLQLFGHDYVRLRDWAAANDFQMRWAARDKEVELSDSHGRRVRFTANSAEAEINNVKFWLSHPVALAGGVVCVSRLDLQTTLQSLMFPPKNVFWWDMWATTCRYPVNKWPRNGALLRNLTKQGPRISSLPNSPNRAR